MKQLFILFVIIFSSCNNPTEETEKKTIKKTSIANDTILPLSLDNTQNDLLNCQDTTFSTNYKSSEVAELNKRLINACATGNVLKLTSSLHDLAKVNFDSIHYKFKTILNRTIVDDFNELVIEVSKEKVLNKKPLEIFTYRIQIKIISRNNNIVQYNLSELRNENLCGTWNLVENEVEITNNRNDSLYKIYNQAYFTQHQLNIDSLNLFVSNIVYGHNCGIAGSQPKYRKELENIIITENIEELKKWLNSSTIEIQLYAYEGILRLKNQNVAIDKTTIELMNSIERKEGKAFICSGCTHFQQPIKDVVEEIKKHNTVFKK